MVIAWSVGNTQSPVKVSFVSTPVSQREIMCLEVGGAGRKCDSWTDRGSSKYFLCSSPSALGWMRPDCCFWNPKLGWETNSSLFNVVLHEDSLVTIIPTWEEFKLPHKHPSLRVVIQVSPRALQVLQASLRHNPCLV